MTKKNFISMLLGASIAQVTIVSTPNYNGGRELCVLFNKDEVELGDFEYIEFEGDATEVVRHRSMVFSEHYEPFHEQAYDVDYTLEELVCRALS